MQGMEWKGKYRQVKERKGKSWKVEASKGKLESQLESGKLLYTYKSRFFGEVPVPGPVGPPAANSEARKDPVVMEVRIGAQIAM